MSLKPSIRFSATLLQPRPSEKAGSPFTLTLPKSAGVKFSARGALMVEGLMNGFPFRAALTPNGKGSRMLLVSSALRDASRAEIGEAVAVELTRIGDEPETRLPIDFRKALSASPKAGATWADITPAARRDWILWITSAKQSGTRRHRIASGCDMLASGKRRVCCFGGLGWLTKDYKGETWTRMRSPSRRGPR